MCLIYIYADDYEVPPGYEHLSHRELCDNFWILPEEGVRLLFPNMIQAMQSSSRISHDEIDNSWTLEAKSLVKDLESFFVLIKYTNDPTTDDGAIYDDLSSFRNDKERMYDKLKYWEAHLFKHVVSNR